MFDSKHCCVPKANKDDCSGCFNLVKSLTILWQPIYPLVLQNQYYLEFQNLFPKHRLCLLVSVFKEKTDFLFLQPGGPTLKGSPQKRQTGRLNFWDIVLHHQQFDLFKRPCQIEQYVLLTSFPDYIWSNFKTSQAKHKRWLGWSGGSRRLVHTIYYQLKRKAFSSFGPKTKYFCSLC